jgi:hypothetical protein
VSAERKQQAFSFGGAAAVYAMSAALPLMALPRIHEPFEYLVDGVFATAVSLSALFVWFLKGRL